MRSCPCASANDLWQRIVRYGHPGGRMGSRASLGAAHQRLCGHASAARANCRCEERRPDTGRSGCPGRRQREMDRYSAARSPSTLADRDHRAGRRGLGRAVDVEDAQLLVEDRSSAFENRTRPSGVHDGARTTKPPTALLVSFARPVPSGFTVYRSDGASGRARVFVWSSRRFVLNRMLSSLGCQLG